MAAMVSAMDVVFHVDCSCTEPGEQVFVVASCKELGAWNPAEALPCFTSSATFPRWTSNAVKLPIGSRTEFKIVIRGHRGNRWEHGDNRHLKVELPVGVEATKMVSLTYGQQGMKDAEDAAASEVPTLPMLLGVRLEKPGLKAVPPSKAASPSEGDVEEAPAQQEGRFHVLPNMGSVMMEHGPNGEEPAIKAAARMCAVEPAMDEKSIRLLGAPTAIRQAKRVLQLFVSKTFICTFQMPTPEATAAAGRMLGKVPWVWDVKLHGYNLIRLNAHEACLEKVCASMSAFSSCGELRRRNAPGSERQWHVSK
ncbi:cgt [Symbiodinium natans]|uniref:Cgt protein n=1 Tax=Symbiodinium natans TaxID=878477 RepID=A0A812KHW0_9DINO|nr:cgt [Symbiodinium natans]